VPASRDPGTNRAAISSSSPTRFRASDRFSNWDARICNTLHTRDSRHPSWEFRTPVPGSRDDSRKPASGIGRGLFLCPRSGAKSARRASPVHEIARGTDQSRTILPIVGTYRRHGIPWLLRLWLPGFGDRTSRRSLRHFCSSRLRARDRARGQLRHQSRRFPRKLAGSFAPSRRRSFPEPEREIEQRRDHRGERSPAFVSPNLQPRFELIAHCDL
jgi:hypothetical protein